MGGRYGDMADVADAGAGTGTARLHVVRGPAGASDRDGGRDGFRAAVAALDPCPVRELLTAIAYARDEAARTRSTTASTGRWIAVVAAAERAVAARVREQAEAASAVA
jgi:hypothetical protein